MVKLVDVLCSGKDLAYKAIYNKSLNKAVHVKRFNVLVILRLLVESYFSVDSDDKFTVRF